MLFWGKMPLKMRIWGVFEVNLPNLLLPNLPKIVIDNIQHIDC